MGKDESNFCAMMSRMKYIDRWALMRNSCTENICEHSLEVAMIAHMLCVIGNKRFGKNWSILGIMWKYSKSDIVILLHT